jgi:tetratricopeptide (TPR) repeat protein
MGVIMKRLEERFKERPEKETIAQKTAEVSTPVNVKSKISPVDSVFPPFQSRKDRVGRYFRKYLKNFVFDEFSDSYLSRLKKDMEFMKGVPIPLRPEDYQAFKGGEGVKALHIAENMAWVMGIDPKFQYTPQYVEFMNRLFNQRSLLEGLLKEGRDAAEKEDFDNAIIHFRAALILRPDYLHAMYSYARVCREFYLRGNDDKYIGRFKAESMEYFELLTQVHPRFAQAYYYLGYDYLNLGLYQKAALVWQEFLRKSTNLKDKKEIKRRLTQLEQPITIEKGCNAILAGRWWEGMEILEPFLDTNFKGWWPLHYYLGVAYARTGSNAKAVASFKRVLGINGSHVETMKELAELYAISKDKDNERKYRQKAELILSRIAEQEGEEKEED